MILTADYHTHTTFSHGKSSILQNAMQAKAVNLKEIAITDHGYGHRCFAVKKNQIEEIKRLCQQATKQTGVKVLFGLETNILGISGKTDMYVDYISSFDLYLAGIHKFIKYDALKEWFKLLGENTAVKTLGLKPSKELIKRNTQVYINAIKSNPIDILTHPLYGVYADAQEVAKCCYDYGTYFEISARKVHLTDEEWLKVASTGVEFVVSSDAHISTSVGNVDLAKSLIERTSLPKNKIKNLNGNTVEFKRFNEYKNKL